MKKEEYLEAETRGFVWNHLWRSDSQTFVACPVLDMVEIDNIGNVQKWLFTTRDGEVKSKAAKSRNIAGVLKGLRCHVDQCEAGFHGYFCNPSSEGWYTIRDHDHLKQLVESHTSDMIIVPHPHPDGSAAKFLEVKLWRDEKHAILEPKIKCYWLSHASAAGKVQTKKNSRGGQLPTERLVCRNNALNNTARTFVFNLLAQLENRASIKVSQFRVILHVAEIPSVVPNTAESSDAASIFRVHFHHARHLVFESAGFQSNILNRRSDQFSQSLGEISTKLSSHGFLARQASITSSAASATTYIKPWTYCAGCFCTYAAIAADGTGAAVPSMGLDFEDGDVMAESQRAIQRHRPIENPLSSSAGGATESSQGDNNDSRRSSRASARKGSAPAIDMGGDANNGAKGSAEGLNAKRKNDDMSSSEARIGSLLPLKTNKLLYKHLVLVRDEIRRLEEIDRQYVDEAHDTSEKLDAIFSMREAMKGIWPLPLIRWWFAHGQFYAATHSTRGGVGRLPATVNPEAIVPPSVLSKLEKQKQVDDTNTILLHPNGSMGSKKSLGDESDGDDEDSLQDSQDQNAGSQQGRKNGKLRPPKLPKEPPTAQSLSLPEAIANPLSQANPAIPYSDKSNVHLSDATYPSRQSLINNPEDTKWFSLHHQDVTVCDQCYLVYCRLETFRKSKFQKLRELLKQESREKLNPEEQRNRDREIERRIFSQKQSTYKLSQVKARRNEDGEIETVPHHYQRHGRRTNNSNMSVGSSGSSVTGAPKGALPPLPWKLNDEEERDRYLAPASHSMAEKLMKKVPMRSMSAESGMMINNEEDPSQQDGPSMEEIDSAWDAVMNKNNKKGGNPSRLPPLSSNGGSASTGSLTSSTTLRKPTNLTVQQSLKVAVDQYTAENLLHPWQRDLKRLKEALHDVTGLNPAPSAASASNNPVYGQSNYKNNTSAADHVSSMNHKTPLGNIPSSSSKTTTTSNDSAMMSSPPAPAAMHKQSSFNSKTNSNGGGSLVKSVSFRDDNLTGSPSKASNPMARQASFDSLRPGTTASSNSNSRVSSGHSINSAASGNSHGGNPPPGMFDKDGLRNYNRQSSWSQSIPELARLDADDTDFDKSSNTTTGTNHKFGVGIADEDDDDDDMDIAGGGLGWNPFVLQQAH